MLIFSISNLASQNRFFNCTSSERELCLSDCRTSAPLDADFAAAGLRCALDLADAALGLWAETPAAAELVRGFGRRFFA